MPELPDVEGFRRLLSTHVVGQKVEGVDVRDLGVARGCSGQEFALTTNHNRLWRGPVRSWSCTSATSR